MTFGLSSEFCKSSELWELGVSYLICSGCRWRSVGTGSLRILLEPLNCSQTRLPNNLFIIIRFARPPPGHCCFILPFRSLIRLITLIIIHHKPSDWVISGESEPMSGFDWVSILKLFCWGSILIIRADLFFWLEQPLNLPQPIQYFLSAFELIMVSIRYI